MLQGSLPIPPPSTRIYLVSNNNLTGGISPLICSLNNLYALDLSNNNLTGKLPRCLESFSTSLDLLNLRRNSFHGKIPQPHSSECNLRTLILDYNLFQGKMPKSLANCAKLEILTLGNNQINDAFPPWLGALQELKVLILRSNQFHGVLGAAALATKSDQFQKLHIIDLSQNNFSGQLPTQYILNWNAMKIAEADSLIYMEADETLPPAISTADDNYSYSLTITNKGINRAYGKILEFFIAIDLSSNRFEGKIPEFFGNLKGLRSLNLANNLLIGGIPSSLGSLYKLESLDLSQNKLSGKIPLELTQLTFLSFFNVSHNHLTGSIPLGKQFGTFDNNSFEGNAGLCGSPLSKKCEIPEMFPSPPPSSSRGDYDSRSAFEFSWKPVVMGYGSGFIVGAIIGHIVFKKKPEWFVKMFGTRRQRMRRIRTRSGRRRN